MVAIDPPYRFDPWQNLVNVHWERGTSTAGGQIFIFRRFDTGQPGDWYPVSDQFAYDAYVAGDFRLEFDPGGGAIVLNTDGSSNIHNFLVWTERRNKRSDLIKDGLSQSLGISETDRTHWAGSFYFYYWNVNSLLLPGLGTPQVQPSRPNGTHTFIYWAIVGSYDVDDMTPSDWSDLANGVGAFNGVPQFIPP